MRDPIPRDPSAFADLNAVVITTATTVFDPGAGNFLRLMGGTISVSADGSVLFTEETSGTFIFRTPVLPANSPWTFDLYSEGRRLATAGKKLKAILSVAGTITGTLWGEASAT